MIKLRNLDAEVIAAIASGAGSEYGVYTPDPGARKVLNPGTNGTANDGFAELTLQAQDDSKIVQSLANAGEVPAVASTDALLTAAKLVLINLALSVKAYTGLAPAADMDYVLHDLDANANAVGVTDFTPTPGKLALISCSDATNAVTVQAGAGVTFDGANDLATFGANKALLLYGVSATRWLILANVGAVTFSTV